MIVKTEKEIQTSFRKTLYTENKGKLYFQVKTVNSAFLLSTI